MRIGAAGHHCEVSDHCRGALDVRSPRASTESLARPTFGERLEALNRADQFVRTLHARAPANAGMATRMFKVVDLEPDGAPSAARPEDAPRLGAVSPVTPERTERVVRAVYEIPVALSRGFTLDVLA